MFAGTLAGLAAGVVESTIGVLYMPAMRGAGPLMLDILYYLFLYAVGGTLVALAVFLIVYPLLSILQRHVPGSRLGGIALVAMINATFLCYGAGYALFAYYHGTPAMPGETRFYTYLVPLYIVALAVSVLVVQWRTRNPMPSENWVRVRRALPLIALAGFLVTLGLRHPDLLPFRARADRQTDRVLLIAVDGASWRVFSPMIQNGELPNIGALAERGRSGDLYSLPGFASPVLWTSAATGKLPRKHGIYSFVDKEAGLYSAKPVESGKRTTKALWNILSDLGLRVCVVNWPVTWPPERVNGVMISRVMRSEEGQIYPPELQPEINEIRARFPEIGRNLRAEKGEAKARLRVSTDRSALFDSLAAIRDRANAHLRITEETALTFLNREPWNLFAVYLHTTDELQHHFWKYTFPDEYDHDKWELTPESISGFGDTIAEHWRRVDRFVGRLVEQAGDSYTVVLVSDHGHRPRQNLDPVLSANGILEAMGYLSFEGDSQQVDFDRTLAFVEGTDRLDRIYGINLNVRGRDPRGVVDPSEAASIAAQLREDLMDLQIDTEGNPLFDRVVPASQVNPDRFKNVDILAYRRPLAELEDPGHILLTGDKSYPLEEFLSFRTKTSSEHEREGVVIVAGDGIPRGRFPMRLTTPLGLLFESGTDASPSGRGRLALTAQRLGLLPSPTLLDLTPTILALMGRPMGADMDGQPQSSFAPFIDDEGVRSIPSYDWVGEEREVMELDSKSDDQIREDLRALGYIN